MAKGTKTAHYLLLVSGLLLLTAACKKHTGNDGDGNQTPPVNVFVLGTVGDSAVHWKNGVPAILPGYHTPGLSGQCHCQLNLYTIGVASYSYL